MSKRRPDEKHKVERNSGHIYKQELRNGESYLHGVVATKYGYVWVAYSQEAPAMTRLGFILDGYEYDRSLKKGFSERGLTTVAGRFARESWGRRNKR